MLKDKRGNILTGNVIFIVLYLFFISILLIFVFSKSGAEPILEEKYAKQIVLLIDNAEPIMTITLNMEDAIKKAAKNNFPLNEIVKINENLVTVRLKEENKGYTYSFFNDAEVNVNFDTVSRTKYYFVISENG